MASSSAHAQPSARISAFEAEFHGGGVSGAQVDDFDPDVLEYSVAASVEHTTFSFFFHLEDPSATVSLNGTPLTVNDGAVFAEIPISVPYVGTLALESGTESRSYVINALATSPNAKLATLTTSRGEFNVPFNPGYPTHQLLLAKEQIDVQVTATPQEPDATMTLDGVPLAAGMPSAPIGAPAWPGSRQVVIRVTAPNGRTTREYALTLTRLRGGEARLSNIELSPATPLTPEFSPDAQFFEVALPYAVNSIQVRPSAIDPDARITFGVGVGIHTPVASGAQTPPIEVPVGTSDVQFQVTSENEASIRGYSLRITRALDPAVSVQTFGSSLQCCPMNAAPNQTVFGVSAQPHQRSASIMVTTVDPNATMIFNGAPLSQGVASSPVDLSTTHGWDNPLVLPLTVTSADGQRSQQHEVRFSRTASMEDRLSDLVIEGGELVPAFNPNQVSFYVNVPPGGSIRLRATAMDSGARLETFGLRQGPLSSGELSELIPVPDGDTELAIRVTAEDTRVTRSVSLYLRTVVPDVNTLRYLYFEGGVLSPEFSPEVQQYTLRMSSVVSETYAFLEATDLWAAVRINGQPASPRPPISVLGENPRAVITVTAQNGAVREYVVNIVRANSPPTLSMPSYIEIDEDEEVNVPIEVRDIDSPAESLGAFGRTTSSLLFQSGALTVVGTGEQRMLSVIPNRNAFGTAVVTVSVFDNDGGLTTQDITIVVRFVNDAPNLDLWRDIHRMSTSTASVVLPNTLHNIHAGADNESGQSLQLEYRSTTLRGTTELRSLDWDLIEGEIVFSVNGEVGLLALDFRLRDNGGTERGGVDVSPWKRLLIQVSSASNAVDLGLVIEPVDNTGSERR